MENVVIGSIGKLIRSRANIEPLFHKIILDIYDSNQLYRFGSFFTRLHCPKVSEAQGDLMLESTAADICYKALVRLGDGLHFVKFVADIFEMYFSSPAFRNSLFNQLNCKTALEVFDLIILRQVNLTSSRENRNMSQSLSNLCISMAADTEFKLSAVERVSNDEFLAFFLRKAGSPQNPQHVGFFNNVEWIDRLGEQMIEGASSRLFDDSNCEELRLTAWHLMKTIAEYGSIFCYYYITVDLSESCSFSGDILSESQLNAIIATFSGATVCPFLSIDEVCDALHSLSLTTNRVWKQEASLDMLYNLFQLEIYDEGKIFLNRVLPKCKLRLLTVSSPSIRAIWKRGFQSLIQECANCDVLDRAVKVIKKRLLALVSKREKNNSEELRHAEIVSELLSLVPLSNRSRLLRQCLPEESILQPLKDAWLEKRKVSFLIETMKGHKRPVLGLLDTDFSFSIEFQDTVFYESLARITSLILLQPTELSHEDEDFQDVLTLFLPTLAEDYMNTFVGTLNIEDRNELQEQIKKQAIRDGFHWADIFGKWVRRYETNVDDIVSSLVKSQNSSTQPILHVNQVSFV